MKNLLQRARKKSANTFIACLMPLLFATVMSTAHAQNWLTTGNTLGATGTFGSIDNKNIDFITHNKVTMELAEHLIGVTMREPGVSRLVAVDVTQALME
jgi:hypothetical protein